MVQAIITYTLTIKNTGRIHDLICGCSLLDAVGTEIHPLNWFLIPDVATGTSHNISIETTGDFTEGDYTAKARAWRDYSGSPTWIDDLTDAEANIIGAVYQAGTGVLTGILDEEVYDISIEDVGADITNLVVSVEYL